jgi:methylenetetrahydrofolate reductase (NADPH)
MNMIEKLYDPAPTLSCEYFPPKNPSGWGTLYATLADAQRTGLDFVSVTYGAGGSTRQKTISLVERVQNELAIDAMAHLTCGDHSRAELEAILDELQAAGILAIRALRGDPPRGSETFVVHPDGFRYASELISFIRENYTFKIGCACYPEGHPESATLLQDVDYLKLKQDCGADFAVTQLFFDNDAFYRFRDAARQAGVTIPIIAGLMPVTSFKQLERFQELGGVTIPQKLTDFLTAVSEQDVVERGILYGIEQAQDLLDNGIAGIHLYTLNQSRSSAAIIAGLRERGYYAQSLKVSPNH